MRNFKVIASCLEVISTKPIGPVVRSRRPTLIKTPFLGPGSQQAWQVEIAADERGESIVWTSGLITTPERIQVGSDTGRFIGRLSGKSQLGAGEVYFIRIRQQGTDG